MNGKKVNNNPKRNNLKTKIIQTINQFDLKKFKNLVMEDAM